MSDCTIPFEICRARFTRLTAVGNVAAGPNNSWVTDKITEFVYTPEIETGDDRVLKGGCGQIIAAAKNPDLRKRWTLSLSKGSIEPGLDELLLGDTVILSGPDAIGTWSGPQIGSSASGPPPVAVEVWTKNWEFDHQHPTRPWLHWVFAMSEWQRQAQTLNDDLSISPVAGFTRVNPVWGHGPYGEQPEAMPSGKDVGVWEQAADPPAADCGYKTVAPSS